MFLGEGQGVRGYPPGWGPDKELEARRRKPQELYSAAMNGDKATVQRLLEEGVLPDMYYNVHAVTVMPSPFHLHVLAVALPPPAGLHFPRNRETTRPCVWRRPPTLPRCSWKKAPTSTSRLARIGCAHCHPPAPTAIGLMEPHAAVRP